jgi:hypothetical protein
MNKIAQPGKKYAMQLCTAKASFVPFSQLKHPPLTGSNTVVHNNPTRNHKNITDAA